MTTKATKGSPAKGLGPRRVILFLFRTGSDARSALCTEGVEAAKYNVLPLDNRLAERTNPDIAGRL